MGKVGSGNGKTIQYSAFGKNHVSNREANGSVRGRGDASLGTEQLESHYRHQGEGLGHNGLRWWI